MNRFAPLLLFFALMLAAPVRAALEYLLYTIANQSVATVTAPANGLAAWALNTDEKILFVRDTNQEDTSYYIAVFELTHAQAANLGWKNATANSAVAFGAFLNTTEHALAKPLAYPTTDQWRAYVEEKPSRICNVRYGIEAGSDAKTADAWLADYIGKGASYINGYGLCDTFGNMAECTVDTPDAEPVFRGWYAGSTGNFNNITRDGSAWNVALAAIQTNSLTPVAGVRPVYLPPLEQTYTVTVTLDGQPVSALTQTHLAPGTMVTVTPPTPMEGTLLMDIYTVIPDTITGLSFEMPTQDVTFAFTSKAQATLVVTGGSADPAAICAGMPFTLTADAARSFLYWSGDAGIDDTNKTHNPLILTLDTVDAGSILTYTAHFKPQATLTVTNATASATKVSEGDEVTVTAPTDGSFSHWEGYGIGNTNRYRNPLLLTIDAVTEGEELTLTAVLKPAVTIQVTGGDATPKRVYDGNTFTLTATGNAWQNFAYWEGDFGITESNKTKNPLTLTCSGQTTGTTLTYTAHFTTHPRVLVFGGTATTTDAAADYGEGYYKVGTRLTLAPHTDLPDGYVFSHWLKHDGTTIATQTCTYTVEATDTTTFAAVYKADDSITNTEILHIGAINEKTLKARTAMGYTATATTTHTYTNNTIAYYGTAEAASPYAKLDFATKSIDLTTVTAETANSEANRQTAVVLKRIKPASGQPYYVGIHEITQAQYTNLTEGKLTATSLLPHTTGQTTRGEAATFLAKLSSTFGETFTKPTKAQIATISTGAQNAAQTYGDPAIKATMVNCEANQAGLIASGSKTVDPYGFYDLWGNAAESFADDDENLWGGWYGTPLNFCNLQQASTTTTTNQPGAIRPAITVPKRNTITVKNLQNKTFAVLPNQPLTLKEQIAPGRKFTGWVVTSGSSQKTYTTMPQTLTITANTTLEATFTDPLQSVSVNYQGGCIGPATAFPGTTISVYAETPGQTLETLTVSPATAAICDVTTGRITFAETVTGTVTIQATFRTAAPTAGFHFKLR